MLQKCGHTCIKTQVSVVFRLLSRGNRGVRVHSKTARLAEELKTKVGEADQQSSQLQFIRMLLARCFIEVDSQIIPWRSSMDECIWDRRTAASSCHYNSCPLMLPGATQSKHNGPFWTMVMKSRARCGHAVTYMLAMVPSLLRFGDSFASPQPHGDAVVRTLSGNCTSAEAFTLNCQQNISGTFFNNEKQEDGCLQMAIHAFFIKKRGGTREGIVDAKSPSRWTFPMHSFFFLSACALLGPYAALAQRPQFIRRSQ